MQCAQKNNKSLSRREPALSWALSSPLALSHLETGHAIPFSPQDFCSPCVFVYCSHNTESCQPGSASLKNKKALAGQLSLLEHQSPTFLAPGTSFVKDNFSTDQGRGGRVGWGEAGRDRRQSSGCNASQALLAPLPLTTCSEAWFLTQTHTSPYPRG